MPTGGEQEQMEGSTRKLSQNQTVKQGVHVQLVEEPRLA